MTRTIEIENTGPIELLKHECPDDGGVVVLKARNGMGKSIALNAVDAAVTGRGLRDLQPRDGTLKGRVSAFGATLNISRANRRDGKGLVVESLEGKFDLGTLVDPGLVSVTSADAKRIKALIQLAGVVPDIKLFHELFASPEEAEKILGASAAESDDLVVMAARVKRDIESEALKVEGKVNLEATHAKACREAADGVDITVETDATILNRHVEAALQRQAELRQQARQALDHAAKAEDIQSRIDEAKAAMGKVNTGDLDAREEKCKAEVDRTADVYRLASDDIARLENELIEARKHAVAARHAMETAEFSLDAVRAEIESADKLAETVSEWQKTLESLGSVVKQPSQDEISGAAYIVEEARAAYDAGLRAKIAKEKLAKAEMHEKILKDYTDTAERLRQAAASVDSVLSDQIAKLGCSLRVKDGRLVLDTDRGETYFAELSDGERWRAAIDIAADFLSENGLLTLSQIAWESLDPIARLEIKSHAKDRGVLILAAQCSADEQIVAETL